MKKIVGIDKELGGDGGHVLAQLGVDGENLKAEVSVTYPLAKVIEPATKAVDSLLDKLKAAIPGNWEDSLVDGFKKEYKEELVKLLAEKPAEPQP